MAGINAVSIDAALIFVLRAVIGYGVDGGNGELDKVQVIDFLIPEGDLCQGFFILVVSRPMFPARTPEADPLPRLPVLT